LKGKKRKSFNIEADTNKPKKATKKSPPPKDDEADLDISSIHLDGEETHAVEIYDTCNMIRTKINAFLKAHPKETKTSLARRMNEMPHARNMNIRLLSAFMKKNGYDKGNTCEAFYASYVFFEKLRIKQGKEKSKDRLEMERLWGYRGGFDTTTVSSNKGVSVRQGERITGPNKYGEITIHSA
jgi:hypothetical protein